MKSALRASSRARRDTHTFDGYVLCETPRPILYLETQGGVATGRHGRRVYKSSGETHVGLKSAPPGSMPTRRGSPNPRHENPKRALTSGTSAALRACRPARSVTRKAGQKRFRYTDAAIEADSAALDTLVSPTVWRKWFWTSTAASPGQRRQF